MAFGTTVVNRTVFGNKRVIIGTFTGGAPTGGTITTELKTVEYAKLDAASSITASGGTITVTSAATSGYWWAFGI